MHLLFGPLWLPIALTAGAAQQTGPADARREAVVAPRIEFADPPFAVPGELRDSIRFGWLTVPQDHDDPSAGTIRLALSIVAARAAEPAPDPIVMIPGGPGDASVAPFTVGVARSERLGLNRGRRAIVLLDPRGHGLSEPGTCPELDGSAPLQPDDTLAEAILSRKLVDCRARLHARGVRLETLSAVQTARDIDVLRQALDAPRVNLFGSSYGTRLAAEAMRQVPWAIRAVIMDGPVPPGRPHLILDDELAGGVIAALLGRCAESSHCRNAYPRLEADYDSLLARAARAPVVVPMPRSDRVPNGRILVDSALLRVGLAQLGFNRELAAGAPLLIHTLAAHGLDRLAAMAPQLVRMTVHDQGFGTHLAFLCNDSPVRLEGAAWLRRRCPVWIGERYGDTLALALRSDVPALILTGELDPRTPPAYAEYMARGLTRGQVVVVPSMGHDALPDCGMRMMRDFVEAPERALNVACLDSVPPLRFPTGVVPSRWVGGAVGRAGTHPLRFATPLAAAVLLLLVPFIGLPARALRGRRAGTAGALDRTTIASWLAVAAGVAFVGGAMGAVVAGARQNALLPAVGVPRGWSWILALPWLLLALWSIAVVLAAARRRVAVPPHRLLQWSGLVGCGLLLGLWAFWSLA